RLSSASNSFTKDSKRRSLDRTKRKSLRTSDDSANMAAASLSVRSAAPSLILASISAICHSHIELRGALRDRAVLAQPGKPLAVRHLSPALDKQFAGRDGVLEAILECVGDGGVLGPEARCQLGQVVRFGEGGFHHPFRFPKARGRRRTVNGCAIDQTLPEARRSRHPEVHTHALVRAVVEQAQELAKLDRTARKQDTTEAAPNR